MPDDEDDPSIEWSEDAAPKTTVDLEPATAPHPMLAELAAAEMARMRRLPGERRSWYEEGQRDALLSLQGFLARRGLADEEITNILLDVRKGLMPL